LFKYPFVTDRKENGIKQISRKIYRNRILIEICDGTVKFILCISIIDGDIKIITDISAES